MKGHEMLARSALSMAVYCLMLALWAMNLEAQTSVTKEPFGIMPDGTPVEMYTLSDPNIQARIMTYGGILVSLRTPDRGGKMDDIMLGFDSLDNYVAKAPSLGLLSGDMQIASPRATSHSRARPTRFPSMTATTRCTAARASTKSCGRRSPPRTVWS
jgi:Aldose 1-epimerase